MGQTSSTRQVDYTFGFIANNTDDDKNTPYDLHHDDNSHSLIAGERLLLYPQHYGLGYENDDDDFGGTLRNRLSFPSTSSASSLSLSYNGHHTIDRIDSGYADQDTFGSKKLATLIKNQLAQDIQYVDQLHYADFLVEQHDDDTCLFTDSVSDMTTSTTSVADDNDDQPTSTIGTKLTFAAAALASQDPSMREICLSRRSLVSLSPNIGLLTSLRKLNLCNNQLVELPDSIGQLKQLETLLLSKNQLVRLPDTMQCLTRLTELDLSHNQLQRIHSLGHYSSLCTLLLSHNQLSRVPSDLAGMKHLVTLDLSHNPLSVLPAEMTRLSNLRRLRLDYCHTLLNHKEQQQSMEVELAHDPPSLMEICARKVILSLSSASPSSNKQMLRTKKSSSTITTQRVAQLTGHLLFYLASANICSSCHGPYFETQVVRRRWIERNDMWIPLEYRLCSAHWSDENDRLLHMFHRETAFVMDGKNNKMTATLATLHTLANQHYLNQEQQQLPASSTSMCMDLDDIDVKPAGKVAFLRHPQRLQRVMNKNPSSFLIHKMHLG
ncbi:unnamed protein product [Absidia cylindrospora]